MSFLSKLFSSKDNVSQQGAYVRPNIAPIPSVNNAGAVFHLKGKPDAEGLYPGELVMLAVAEKYKTTESKFPGYLMHDYEIANPPKVLNDLYGRGYLEYGKLSDSLGTFKLQELKDIASALGVPASGKKADIIERISGADEQQLGAYVKERTWKLTDKGKNELKANPYVTYFLEKHTYSVKEVGIDIWTINAEFVKDPKRPYRDYIYRQLDNLIR